MDITQTEVVALLAIRQRLPTSSGTSTHHAAILGDRGIEKCR